MADNRIWVRGIKGRLTRIAQGGPYLPIDQWTKTPWSRRIQKKADRGSLEIRRTDPEAKPVRAKVETPKKEES